MRRINFIALELVAIYLLAAPLALTQGGNPPASTTESGATSGKGLTAVEQTGKGAGKSTKADEDKLISLEKMDWEVTKKKDWKAFDKLLSTDFVWVDDGGVIVGRSNFVKYFTNLDLTGYAMDEVKVTLFSPDVGLVTYKVTEKGSFKGEQLPSKPFYVGSGYLKRGSEWVNIFTQTTLAH